MSNTRRGTVMVSSTPGLFYCEEKEANAEVFVGRLLETTADGKVQHKAAASGAEEQVPVLVATERLSTGEGVGSSYPAGRSAPYATCASGAIILVALEAGDTCNAGTAGMIKAGGYLATHSGSNSRVFNILETKSATSAVQYVEVQVR